MSQRSLPLAVLTPSIGLPSETFVARHANQLEPGGTMVVTRDPDPTDAVWGVEGPVVIVPTRRVRRPPRQRLLAAAWSLRMRVRPQVGWVPHAAGVAALEEALARHRVEVALGEYLDAWLPLVDVLDRAGVRFWAHAHGYDVSRRLRSPYWADAYRRYERAAGVIAVSAVTRDRLVGIGLPADRIHVVPCGVDVPDVPPRRERGETVRCLAVGRLCAKKAPLVTLEAFRRAAARRPELRLDVVGAGPLEEACRRFVADHDLADVVSLHGAVPHEDVRRLLGGADIFLQHSVVDAETGDEEGLPVAVLEAMAAAVPVIATRHGGIPEAVGDGETGWLVDEQDVAAMADRIGRLLDDADVAAEMGRAGWQRAAATFSWDAERDALLGLLGLDRAPAADA